MTDPHIANAIRAAESIESALSTAAFLADYIPAHDFTLDGAATIGRNLDRFRAYIAEHRDPEQADLALSELADAIRLAVPNPAATADDAEAEYSRLMDLKGTLDDRITLVSVRALAQYVREHYPAAVLVDLYHDTYESMEVNGVYDADGGNIAHPVYADTFEDAWHHLSNLAMRGRPAHLAAVAPGVLVATGVGDHYRLNLDAALALPADGSRSGLMCGNCRDAVTREGEELIGSDGETTCPESDRPHGPADVDTAAAEEAGA